MIMELNEFVANFANQFDDTDISEIKPETKYQELDEWSSLLSMSVIAFVKTEYGKTITGKEIRSCRTVKDLYDLVAAK